MKSQNVKMLIRKDLRMSMWVLLAGVIIWSLPLWFAEFGRWYFQDTATPMQLRRVMAMGSSFSVMLSLAAMALVVSHILTSERTDRSAAFLAYVPFSRSEALMSKVLCALALTSVFVMLDGILVATMFRHWLRHYEMPGFAMLMATTGVLVFGGTWLAGSCLRSGAVATVIGLGLPFLLWIGILAANAGDEKAEGELLPVFLRAAVLLGIVFFAAGLGVFMKRPHEV